MTNRTPRRVLVTGSSRGIGAEIARAFAHQGDDVALHGRDPEALRQVQADIRENDGTATTYVADLTDSDAVSRLFDEVGDLDILVVNAGGTSTGFGPIEEIDNATFRNSLEANLISAFLTLKAAVPRMKQRGGGAVVTLSSAATRRPSEQSPAPYLAAKAGLEALTKSLAVQAGPHGIRANCIAPEAILTDTNRARIPAAIQDRMVAAHPIRRLGLPSDVAALAVFLASDDASWLTGAVIDLAGGAVIH